MSRTVWPAAVIALLIGGGCDRESAREPTGSATAAKASPPACLADWARPITTKTAELECAASDTGCRDACLEGDASSCYHLALSLEDEPAGAARAFLFHRRACELGLAIGCTNFAATIWATPGDSEDPVSCAYRLFEKMCEIDEPFACGMYGRMILDSEPDAGDLARGRSVLERSCERLGGFPCRVLAKHLEAGQLGPVDAIRVKNLLGRACESGDDDACGDPDTALETFTDD